LTTWASFAGEATVGGLNNWRGSWTHSTMDTSYGKSFLKMIVRVNNLSCELDVSGLSLGYRIGVRMSSYSNILPTYSCCTCYVFSNIFNRTVYLRVLGA